MIRRPVDWFMQKLLSLETEYNFSRVLARRESEKMKGEL